MKSMSTSKRLLIGILTVAMIPACALDDEPLDGADPEETQVVEDCHGLARSRPAAVRLWDRGSRRRTRTRVGAARSRRIGLECDAVRDEDVLRRETSQETP
jgi:hypothetical protein